MLRASPALRLAAVHACRSPLLGGRPLLFAMSTSRRAFAPASARLLRRFTTAPPSRADAPPSTAAATTTATAATTTTTSTKDAYEFYAGPLSTTFRRLKLFSLSSLGLSFALTPFIFTITSSLPFGARAVLAGTALLTSSFSTALVAWAGRPYVVRMRRLPGDNDGAAVEPHHADAAHAPSHNANTPAGIELETLTLTLRPLRTRVYDPVFFTDARRPFAKWELASLVQLPEPEAAEVVPGTEETVAETLDAAGNVIGRWIVSWREGGEGLCRGEGWIVRHFNVHEDLLDAPIR